MRDACTNSRLANQELRPRQPCGGGPGHKADGNRDGLDVRAENCDEHEQQQEVGQGLERFGDAHQHVVDDPAVIARKRAKYDADGDGEHGRNKPDEERNARAMKDLRGDISPRCVRAEPEAHIREGPLQGPSGKAERIARKHNGRAHAIATTSRRSNRPTTAAGLRARRLMISITTSRHDARIRRA